MCEAFAIARDDVSKFSNTTEANKFVIAFPESKTPHTCKALINNSEGSLAEEKLDPVFNAVPSYVDKFLGR